MVVHGQSDLIPLASSENIASLLGARLEVFEESGVRVRDVSYIASQPWPFPSQLMLGCHSYADDDALVIDETEMAEIIWFTREQVVSSLEGNGPFRAPPPHAIAHNLMKWWIEE